MSYYLTNHFFSYRVIDFVHKLLKDKTIRPIHETGLRLVDGHLDIETDVEFATHRGIYLLLAGYPSALWRKNNGTMHT